MSAEKTALDGSSQTRSGRLVTAVAILSAFGLLLPLLGMILKYPPIIMIGGFVLLAGLSAALFVGQLATYRFTLWILIANLAALIAPTWFFSIGGVSLTNSWLLLIIVQLIMFGMGTQMSVRDFVHVARMPYGVVVGISCQFLIMPLLGYGLARAFAFPPEIGAGLILIGSCSSGLASNVMTYIAKGNLALSVTLTAIATALAPILTPMWMRILASSMIEVDAVKMSLDIVKMVLVPILAAFIHDFLTNWSRRVRVVVWCGFALGSVWLLVLLFGGWNWMLAQVADPSSSRVEGLLSMPGFLAAAVVFGGLYHLAVHFLPKLDAWMPGVSMFGIVYFTLVVTAQGRDQLLAVGLMLLLAVTLHNLLGTLLGYWMSRAFGLNRQDARTVAIEVGMQNGAMATGLAKGMGKLDTVGLAAMIFAPLMNVTESLIANYWRRHPVDIAEQSSTTGTSKEVLS